MPGGSSTLRGGSSPLWAGIGSPDAPTTTDGRFCQMSFSAIWIAAAIGIATNAPSTPSRFEPIRIAVITASGCRFTARR